MTEMTTRSLVRVTDTCWIESHVGKGVNTTGNGEITDVAFAVIGDDAHMNGLDSPARLNTPNEVDRLIDSLTLLRDNWPKSR